MRFLAQHFLPHGSLKINAVPQEQSVEAGAVAAAVSLAAAQAPAGVAAVDVEAGAAAAAVVKHGRSLRTRLAP